MQIENGARVVVRGRYSDFTDHLNGQVVTVVNCIRDSLGYIEIKDSLGTVYYVQAIDVFPYES